MTSTSDSSPVPSCSPSTSKKIKTSPKKTKDAKYEDNVKFINSALRNNVSPEREKLEDNIDDKPLENEDSDSISLLADSNR